MTNARTYMSRHRLRAKAVAAEPIRGKVVALATGRNIEEMAFGEYLVEEWLPALRVDVEPVTYKSAEYHVRGFIVPTLGSLPVGEISRDMLRSFYQELLRTPRKNGPGALSKNSVICIHATISWALQQLVDSGRLPHNPAWGARPRLKGSEKFQPQVWSVGELRVFLDFVAGDELCALWTVLALTGVRRGEALGLQWGDLSPRYSHVAVRRALIIAGGSIYLTSPKAVQSRRIDLDGRTKAALHRHRREQLRRARTGNYKVSGSSFIFTKRNGEWLTPSSVSRRFVKLSAQAGLPRIRLHDLRHTHASHLLEAGANVKAVQERLGHSHPVVTMDTYVHLFPTIQAEAVEKLDQYYREGANT